MGRVVLLMVLLCVFSCYAQDFTYNELMKELKELRNNVRIIENNMEEQRHEIKSQRSRIEALTKVVSSQDIELKTVKRELEEMKNQRAQVIENTQIRGGDRRAANISMLAEPISAKLKGRKDKAIIRKGRIIPQPENTGNIAFYAYMSVPMKNVGEKHSLAFDVVMTNEGNAFHSSTGVFMVPESGLYVFTWSFRLTSGSYHSVELAVNGQSAGVIFSAPIGGAQSGTSATIVIHATKGDDIYLRTKENNVGDIFSNGYGHTSFAGWKLF